MPESIPIFAGVDVGSRSLQLAIRVDSSYFECDFDNDRSGHTKLLRFLEKRGKQAKVCIEATGPYSLDLCKRLDAKGFYVTHVNPRATTSFARARMLRAKTDRVDARMLADFVASVPTVQWRPRTKAMDTFVAIARYLDTVVRGNAREKNMLHASRATESTPEIIREWTEGAIEAGNERIKTVERAALQCIRDDDTLRGHLERLIEVPGIGERTAIHVLGWFVTLPADLTADQVVAYAGLDPRPRESGLHVPSVRSISRSGDSRIRARLYTSAMSACNAEGPFREFRDRLVARGKKGKVALIAVERKLLTILWTLFQSGSAYDPTRVGRRGPP
jgi:transposase